MINYGLIIKLLELNKVQETQIQEVLEELNDMIDQKFGVMMTLFLNKEIDDDNQLEKFAEFIETEDAQTVDPKIQLNKKLSWLQDNIQDLDFDKFMKEFEEETSRLEVDMVKRLQKNLTEDQRTEVLDFIEKQENEQEQAFIALDQLIDLAD